ncbi:HAD family hydrolase [Sulfuricurvum sp.]|uniref:HAD family hydrolase n=1 Tax=Sulfuricurvum sp. TaxID=2025608 RepID=UPI00260D17DB|nr:HAD family hydrolase [Sulfuricurvum sp.]MDD2781225.1 HAD family hydrolase [Sulfuricurvum sp.]
MKTIILFDLDGTLIDSTEAILESFYHSLQTHNLCLEVSDSMITSQIGHTLETMFAGVGVQDDLIDIHVSTYKLYYREIACQKTILLPNAIEAIQEASLFARLGIVTTKTGRYSRELMEYFNLMHYFDTLIGFEDVENRKPHPEPILKALIQMEHKHQEAWMIGDTCLDIEASNRAGIQCVAVTSGYDNMEQLLTLTDVIQRDALEAVRYIAQRG